MESTDWVTKARRDCPPCREVIHLNNAGASLPPTTVLDRQLGYLEEEARIGGYECAARHREEIDGFYDSLARLFGGLPHQYAWATSATDAYNRALGSIPFRRGDVILTTRNDYTSNFIAFLQLEDRLGLRIRVARDLPEGGVDLEDLEKLLRSESPTLVAITQVPSHAGLVQPIAEIGRLCRDHPCWYLVDGCQGAGQLPVDLATLGCDFYSATFRKFLRGPRGAGFLYVSERALQEGLEPMFLDLHSANWVAPQRYEPRPDARRFELWERSYATVLGARAALDYLDNTGMERVGERIGLLTDLLKEELLARTSGRVLYPDARLHGIVSAYFEGQDPAGLLYRLREEGIHTSLARSEAVQLGMSKAEHPWVLRFSPHYYNTTEEIRRAVSRLKWHLEQGEGGSGQ